MENLCLAEQFRDTNSFKCILTERAAVYLDLTFLSYTMLLYKKMKNLRPWQRVILACFPHQSLKLEKYKEFKDNENIRINNLI